MQKLKEHDFSGMATAYEIPCADGRTIGTGAFDHQDQQRVPLVWKHGHESMENILGHAYLYKTPKGIRTEAKFNTTESGQMAKTLVTSGDIESLSVWANQIKQEGSRVIRGMIREVSLVLSGANPGAKIDRVVVHTEGYSDDDPGVTEGIIVHSGMTIELFEEGPVVMKHEDDETIKDILKTMTDEQLNAVGHILLVATGVATGVASDEKGKPEAKGKTVADVVSSLNDKQKDVLYYLVGSLMDNPPVEQSDDEENIIMHNIFEDKNVAAGSILSHEQIEGIFADATSRKASSFKDVVIAHAGTYGIDNVEVLFPEARNVGSESPYLYSRDQKWVTAVMSRVRKSPFARIKSIYADITADEARAKGYVTGAEKFDEVFPVFSRETTPQTVYKRQKLDRDDIVDITSFDVVVWLKAEMKMMMNEELARAILIGDGRAVDHADKIKSGNIRPIWGDNVLYSHLITLDATDDIIDIIDAITASREHYKGSGDPALYVTPSTLISMLLVRDTTNRRIYETEASLKAALRVSEIVEVPVMAGQSRVATTTRNLLAILVDLRDYVLGADKGGELAFFDDFDIDFNQFKYLYETRVSGANVMPKSAIVFEVDTGV